MDVRYERPKSIAEACALLAETRGAVVLAGATDLQIKLRERRIAPPLLVDVKGIPGLDEVRWEKDGALTLGAAVTMRRIHEDARLAESFPALAQAAAAVGSLQVRTRATVGGNLCNASPCMDTAPSLLVLDAKLRLAGPTGERELPLERFFTGVKATSLAPGELCVAVVIPKAHARTTFDKMKRVRGHDLALVNVAVAHDPTRRTLRAAVGACAPTPVLTRRLEDVAPEPRDADALGRELAAAALEVIRPIDDVRASAEYRRDMTALLCRRLTATLFPRRSP